MDDTVRSYIENCAKRAADAVDRPVSAVTVEYCRTPDDDDPPWGVSIRGPAPKRGVARTSHGYGQNLRDACDDAVRSYMLLQQGLR